MEFLNSQTPKDLKLLNNDNFTKNEKNFKNFKYRSFQKIILDYRLEIRKLYNNLSNIFLSFSQLLDLINILQ